MMEDLEEANKKIINEKKLIEQKVKERTKQLRNAYEKLKQLDNAKNEFISIMSHELKSPLFPVLGFLEMMLKGQMGKLTKEQKEKLELVYKNASELLKLIEDMLTLSKMDLKKLNLEMKRNDLAKTLKFIKQDLEPLAKKHNVKIYYIGPKKLFIKCDAFRITQAINNLVRNAIFYNKQKNGRVKLRLKKEGQKVIIEVEDNGIGIPKKDISNLFNRFYQVEKAATRSHEGSGLGLAITKGIVELHKGKIMVKSQLGKGSTFTIILPIKED
jgi:signal transduction histidine kinase